MKGPIYYGAMHFSDGADEDTEYFYDSNGNTVKDLNRGITGIEYDVNNLPVKVTFKDGSTISTVYDADGNKLSVTHHTALKSVKFPLSDIMPCDSIMLCDSIRADLSDVPVAARMPGDSTLHDMSSVQLEKIEKTVTDYSGSFIYRNGALDKILFEGGYITYSGGSATFHFYIQDHLGSTRAVVTNSGVVEQATHYYPFGAVNGAISTGFDVQPYKYNGKELDRTNGYDMMDYGARMYAADLGRWMVMDLLAEKYYDISPYAYCHNNPVNRIDPDGMDDYFNESGIFLKRTPQGTSVMVKSGERYKKITEVDFSDNRNVIRNIGSHYLKKYDRGNFSLTVSNTGGNRVPQDAAFSHTINTRNYDIYLTDGYVNPSLGDYNDFECIAYHESTHMYNINTGETAKDEIMAIIETTKCKAWNNATDGYIRSQASYAAKELNKLKTDTDFNNYLQRTNTAFKGYATFEFINDEVQVINQLSEILCIGKLGN